MRTFRVGVVYLPSQTILFRFYRELTRKCGLKIDRERISSIFLLNSKKIYKHKMLIFKKIKTAKPLLYKTLLIFYRQHIVVYPLLFGSKREENRDFFQTMMYNVTVAERWWHRETDLPVRK